MIDVLPSRKKAYLRFYFRAIPSQERERVHYISMDMYDTYRQIANIYLPNALVCADPFHVMKNINEYLNTIRHTVRKRFENTKEDKKG